LVEYRAYKNIKYMILYIILKNMSLANKYRPETFDTIVAQDHITDILKAQIKSDQPVHHNYLFFGPRGT
jgi:DNA polymerase III gamma/tau subunit